MIAYDVGDLIFTSRPFVHVLSTNHRGKLCDDCFERRDKFLRCSACKVARYCSVNCQKSAWKLHKWECEALRRVSPQIPTDSVRLLYRLVLKIQKCDGTGEHEDVFGKKRTFDSLMSHVAAIRSDQKRTGELVQLCHTLREFAGDSLQITPEDLLDIIGKMVINSFCICDEEMLPVGVGLYLGASALDHSCDPDAVVVFRGTEVHVRCVRPTTMEQLDAERLTTVERADPAKLSPVTISYTDQLADTESRQEALRSQYYFTCRCTACDDVQRDSDLLAGKCPRESCSGKVTATSGHLECSNCSTMDFSSTYIEKRSHHLKTLKDTIGPLKEIQKQNDYPVLLESCEKHLTECSTFLHPSCVYVVQLYDLAMDSCVQLGLWPKAVNFGKEVSKGFRQHYSDYHPTLGVHLMKLGKVLLYVQELEDSLLTLQQAEDILSVTHGKDHRLCRDLRELITQCVEELRGHLS